MLRNLKLRSYIFGIGLAFLAAISINSLPWAQNPPQAASFEPFTAEQFGRYVAEWSEPDGYFDTDNFISNETSYLHVVGDLHSMVKPGGLYLGVGPDQNFSYIVHTRPDIAIIVDIRRQNMLQLLFYRALFSMAENRAEYLARLFAREKIVFRNDAPLPELLRTIRTAATSEQLFNSNVESLKETILRFKVNLSAEDFSRIEYIYRTFWLENLDLRFSSLGRGNRMNYPRFEEMLLQTDRQGDLQNYLATEQSFQWLKEFQAENRLVPITGDFAGSKAFKAVSAFMEQNGLRIATFYTSNVEFYLFGSQTWTQYMTNVQALPIDPLSVMIRADFTYGRRHPENVTGHRSTSAVHSMKRFIDDYSTGKIKSYFDVVVR